MLLVMPKTETEKVALILEATQWPGETAIECVERLIREGMLPIESDRTFFRQFAKGGEPVKSDPTEKSCESPTVRMYRDAHSKTSRPADGFERHRSWRHS